MKSPQSSPKPKKHRFYLRRIVGVSMLPTLPAGQLVVIVPFGRPKVGDIVMVRHEGLEKIKRVARIDNARLYLLGDNSTASTDSRHFGWVGIETVVGRAVWPTHSRLKTVI